MSWKQLIESIDWRVVFGFVCFELLLLWLRWVETTPVLPDPDDLCVACGEPRHYVKPIEWDVGPGRSRYEPKDLVIGK